MWFWKRFFCSINIGKYTVIHIKSLRSLVLKRSHFGKLNAPLRSMTVYGGWACRSHNKGTYDGHTSASSVHRFDGYWACTSINSATIEIQAQRPSAPLYKLLTFRLRSMHRFQLSTLTPNPENLGNRKHIIVTFLMFYQYLSIT